MSCLTVVGWLGLRATEASSRGDVLTQYCDLHDPVMVNCSRRARSTQTERVSHANREENLWDDLTALCISYLICVNVLHDNEISNTCRLVFKVHVV